MCPDGTSFQPGPSIVNINQSLQSGQSGVSGHRGQGHRRPTLAQIGRPIWRNSGEIRQDTENNGFHSTTADISDRKMPRAGDFVDDQRIDDIAFQHRADDGDLVRTTGNKNDIRDRRADARWHVR